LRDTGNLTAAFNQFSTKTQQAVCSSPSRAVVLLQPAPSCMQRARTLAHSSSRVAGGEKKTPLCMKAPASRVKSWLFPAAWYPKPGLSLLVKSCRCVYCNHLSLKRNRFRGFKYN